MSYLAILNRIRPLKRAIRESRPEQVSNRLPRWGAFFACLALLMPAAHAAIPPTINYQGDLTNAAAAPVNGPVSMTFRIYNAATAGTLLYTETQPAVAVSNGSFNAIIGAIFPLALPFDVPYWLTVSINTDNEMTPRQPLASSPYAFRAVMADALTAGATIATTQLSGTISSSQFAATQLLPTIACATNQIAKWNGTAWTCGTDADTNSGGTVTSITAGGGLTGGTITGIGTIAVDPASAVFTNNYFKFGGNNFGAIAVLGSTNNVPVEIIANGRRVARFESTVGAPNVAFGSASNVAGGVDIQAATVGGGGIAAFPNLATATYATVAGGVNNKAQGEGSTVGGGNQNTASISYTTVSGGFVNRASGDRATVAGGSGNTASNIHSTVGGGLSNTASGVGSTVGGGLSNTASGGSSTVGGGEVNTASGVVSTVGGGLSNTASGFASFAAGRQAKTQTAGASPVAHNGAFVWADNNFVDFNSTAANEFSARATGGFRFVTAINTSGTPTAQVSINPAAEMSFGSQTRQMLNLWSTTFGIGVQDFSLYFRSPLEFQWFRGGAHVNAIGDPGAGGTRLMNLTSSGLSVNGTFVSISDRNAKENFAAVDAKAVLEKVVALPIESWNYRDDEKKVRHLGPMAQDFFKAFAIGPDDKHIATVDEGGVALAAIQGLHQVVNEKDAEIKQQRARIELLEAALAAIQSRLGMR